MSRVSPNNPVVLERIDGHAILVNAAAMKAAGVEELMGGPTPGKYADFVILDRDIMTVPAAQILGTRVLATYIGGRAVYERSR